MDRAAAAEGILRLAVSRERASEVVGDLLESRPRAVRFWLAVAWLSLVFSWKTVVAAVVTPLLGGVAAACVSTRLLTHSVQDSYAAGRVIHTGWDYIPGILFFLWSFTFLALARYRWSSLARAALFATAIVSIAVFFFPLRHGVLTILLLAMSVCVYGAVSRQGFQSLGVMSASILTTALPCYLLIAANEYFKGGELTPATIGCVALMPALQGMSTEYFYNRWLRSVKSK